MTETTTNQEGITAMTVTDRYAGIHVAMDLPFDFAVASLPEPTDADYAIYRQAADLLGIHLLFVDGDDAAAHDWRRRNDDDEAESANDAWQAVHDLATKLFSAS